MKTLIFCFLLGCIVAGCRVNDPATTCRFVGDTLTNHMNKPLASDANLDSARSYTYNTQLVSMDSLLPALCTAGVRIDSAYFVTSYLCMDPRGPRPVVLLHAADATMLNRGFTAGATGRLSCAAQLTLYTPAK